MTSRVCVYQQTIARPACLFGADFGLEPSCKRVQVLGVGERSSQVDESSNKVHPQIFLARAIEYERLRWKHTRNKMAALTVRRGLLSVILPSFLVIVFGSNGIWCCGNVESYLSNLPFAFTFTYRLISHIIFENMTSWFTTRTASCGWGGAWLQRASLASLSSSWQPLEWSALHSPRCARLKTSTFSFNW